MASRQPVAGSPPPMRGKVPADSLRSRLRGITPAYAGKSGTFAMPQFTQQDHPRLCGEKPERSRLYPCREGSPPPMRGKACVEVAKIHFERITPAYAGKRRCGQHSGLSLQDHPRLCGEKTSTIMRFGRKLGSPPPMRGKVPKSGGVMSGDRITPAYAGKRRKVSLVSEM